MTKFHSILDKMSHKSHLGDFGTLFALDDMKSQEISNLKYCLI